MYIRSDQHLIRRSYSTKDAAHRRPQPDNSTIHRARVLRELRQLGVSHLGMSTMEAKYLPRIIHRDERLGGILYGFHEDGIALLVATDRRIIFLDKKPLFVNEDEINYFVVSGVSYSHVGWGATVTLHTRVKDYTIHTFNQPCAKIFVEFIERRCLERNSTGKENGYDQS